MKGLVYAGATAGLAFSSFVGWRRAFIDHAEPPQQPFDWVGDGAMVLAYGLPALLALLALRGRPILLLAAAILGLPLAFTLLSGVSLVLLLPSAAYVAAFIASGARIPVLPGAIVVLGVAVLGFAALHALFAREDIFCWEYVVRTDGTTVYREVPASDMTRVEDGQRVFTSPPGGHSVGPGEVEAGGGCDDRITVVESIASFSLAALTIAGAALLGRVREPLPS